MPPEAGVEHVDAIIFIPFTDGELSMVLDTLESIDRFVEEPHHVIAVDDCSRDRLDETLRRARPDITVFRNERKNGGRSGLYVTMANACKHALDRFSFRVFMKMDTDALMVGPGLVAQTIRYFEGHPEAGILGSYRVRADGQRRSWLKWKLGFLYEANPLRALWGQKPLWRDPIRMARRRAYDVGENVLGGAYLIRRECLDAMRRDDLLDYEYEAVLSESRIGDEIIFSLMCKAAGFDLHDFGSPEHSMALALTCLPLAKEEILRQHKTVIHSVKRGKDGESQEELRAFFRSRADRTAVRPSTR
jgi:glycosyltransferase involved in cell wall biosynthesis